MDAYREKQLLDRIEKLEAELEWMKNQLRSTTYPTGGNGYTTFPNYQPIWVSNGS